MNGRIAIDGHELRAAVDAQLPLAESLFDEIRSTSAADVGVTRPAWSTEDQFASDRIAHVARLLGLETAYDHAGNLYCTLPGRDRRAPARPHGLAHRFRADGRAL